MGRPISYEMQMMFVGSPGAFEEAMNTGSGISRLDFIQSYDFSFNIERTPLKQIGSDSFATRQTQLAPDVNLNIQYYLNDGWNDKYIGLDIPTDVTGNPFDSILSSTGDRNFYISIAQNDGMDQNLQTGIVNSNILAVGNAYITNYEISVAVNQLATVSCSFVGANANVQDYATSKYLPSVNTIVSGQNAQDANKNFALNFVNNSRTERYLPKTKEIFNGGCPYSKCKITPNFQSGGGTSPITFGFFDAIANNFQSMQFSVGFERKALYGFGNNHPYIRKIQRPTVATLSLSALIDDFQAENLSKVFHAEGGTQKSMLIEFFNLEDIKKFGLSLQNLTLESYNLGARIGDRVLVETNWTVEVKNGAGADIGMVGSYGPPLLDVTKVNESFAVETLFFEGATARGVSIFNDKNSRLWGWGINNSYSNPSNGIFDSFERQVSTPKKMKVDQVFNKISAGKWSFLAIDKNGKGWAWGYNADGELGDNSTTSRYSPVAIYGNKTFCHIANVGDYYSRSIGLDKNGKAWTWGNVSGLYYIPNSHVINKTPVAVPGNKTFCKVDVGFQGFIAIDKNGKAWEWSSQSPVAVAGNRTFCQISAGYDYNLAIDKNGKAWAWGNNYDYQLGIGSGAGYEINSPTAIYGNKTFCKIFALKSDDYDQYSFAIDKNGKAWGWGTNNVGQLGDNSATLRITPVAVCGNKTFCHIYLAQQRGFLTSADDNPYGYTIGIDKNNIAWAWGLGLSGVLGNGINPWKCVPYLLNDTKTFCKIAVGNNVAITIDKNGLAQYDGLTNIYGNKTVCHAAINFSYSTSYFILDQNGKAWAWGNNTYGQLGDNSTVYRSTPVAVYGNKTFCKIFAGGFHVMAIDKNNKTWAWGANFNGTLGDNSTLSRSTPVAVCGNKTFCEIALGESRSFAIDKNGKAWGWGYNSQGRLGDNSTVCRSTPFAIYGNKTFCKIFTSNEATLALDKNGKPWAWGVNYKSHAPDYGLFFTTEFSIKTPVAISVKGSDNNFCDAELHGYESYFLVDNNGKAWGWGYNGYGHLGRVSNEPLTPGQVCGNILFYTVKNNGIEFGPTTYGIDKLNRLWAWGVVPGINPSSRTPYKVYNQ